MVLCLVCADGIFGYGRPWITENKHDDAVRIEEVKESDRSLGSKPTTTLYSTTRYHIHKTKTDILNDKPSLEKAIIDHLEQLIDAIILYFSKLSKLPSKSA